MNILSKGTPRRSNSAKMAANHWGCSYRNARAAPCGRACSDKSASLGSIDNDGSRSTECWTAIDTVLISLMQMRLCCNPHSHTVDAGEDRMRNYCWVSVPRRSMEAAAIARVRPVLKKGAAARAATCMVNLRRVAIDMLLCDSMG